MQEFSIRQKLMGSSFELKIVSDREEVASENLQAGIEEIRRLETMLTEYSESSQTSWLNKQAGIRQVTVDGEVFQLLKRSQAISKLTQGAFDITAGPLKKIYRFNNSDFQMPDKAARKEALSKVGFQHISLRANNKVYLRKKGMHISFAAIGKGYAADRVRKLWQENGIRAGVINASGDLTVFGKRPDGSAWKVGIANPERPAEMLGWVPLENASVATSGDYEQFFMHNGTRYSHNIDPKTGRPLTGIKSATIIGPNAELCDALATAVYVMGVEAGLHLVAQLPNIHCLIVDDKNKVWYSKDLNIERP